MKIIRTSQARKLIDAGKLEFVSKIKSGLAEVIWIETDKEETVKIKSAICEHCGEKTGTIWTLCDDCDHWFDSLMGRFEI